MQKRIIPILIGIFALAGIAYFWLKSAAPQTQSSSFESIASTPTAISSHAPEVLPLANSPLKASITAAGDYLVRQQLANGELAYQVNLQTNDR